VYFIRRRYKMKRFTVLVVAVLVVMAMVCTAGAADFSGKWVNYKMLAQEGDEKMEVNFEEMLGDDFVEDEVGYVEFKDGKAYVCMTGDDEVKDLEYKAAGDKLTVEVIDEMKAEGITSIEFFFEGEDLVWSVTMEGGSMNNYYRRPK